MLKLRALILSGLCFAAPAQAGLFADETARNQAQKLEARVVSLDETLKQQTKAMLDLQGQIETLNGEIRKLRGQNEEVAHGLQDAEKRQKDFYVDLDSRMRHFESAEAAAQEAAKEVAQEAEKSVAAKEVAQASAATPVVSADPNDPAPENRAFENAYGVFKGGNYADAVKMFKDFLKKYPDSVHAANANYWLGNAQFALREYKGALATYRGLIKEFPNASKAADTYLNMAEAQRALKQKSDAQKTLKQLTEKYPDSGAAAKARKLLSTSK